MVKFVTEHTLGLMLVLLALIPLTSCAVKVLKPANCDLTAIDQFNEFSKDFENCAANGNQCGSFSNIEIPEKHEILLESSGSFTRVSLICDEQENKIKFFDNIGLCVSVDNRYSHELDEFNLDKDVDRTFSRNGNINLKRIREGEVCFDKIPERNPFIGTGLK
ncbi:MAG: hypothetical protein CMH62_02230 [Nanoarchaeota archaeon]|nr:hypothetical protein [Nanoarchaeota archaeon]|tara:strand:- start:4402 stop:4890 length:489 start_codon:yes stop_codon:yes gene_type:complete